MESLINPQFNKLAADIQAKVKYSRLFLVMKFESEEKETKQKCISEWSSTVEDILSGLIMWVEQYVLMFLEGATDELFKTLDDLPDVYDATNKNKLNENCRILQFSDLNRIQILHSLITLYCQPSNRSIDNSHLQVTDKLWECYRRILEFSFQIAKIDKNETQDFCEKIENEEYMPTVQELNYFINDVEASKHIWGYSDFREFFQSTFKLKLDSERAWPTLDITANKIN